MSRSAGEIRNLSPDEHDDVAWFSLTETGGLELANGALAELLSDALEFARLQPGQ